MKWGENTYTHTYFVKQESSFELVQTQSQFCKPDKKNNQVSN